MAKSKTYYCWRECVYGPRRRRRFYRLGEKLEPGIPPGKYFSEDGEPPDHLVNKMPVLSAGDDPRSTVEMVEHLKDEYGVDMPDGASRKEVFYKLKLEEAKAENAKKKAEKAEEVVEEEKDDAAVSDKKFMEMTPDEVDALDSKEISKIVKSRYGIHLKPTSKNKEELLDKAIQLEAGDE